jgi:DNA-binding HxlR family transcriptional regulator
MHSSELSEIEMRCLRAIDEGKVRIFPPPVTHATPDNVLARLESLGLIERIAEPALPLEVRQIYYRLTAKGQAVLVTAQSP